MKERKRRRKGKAYAADDSIGAERVDWENARARNEDIAYVSNFFSKIGGFPNGLLLSAAVLRADHGVHNVVLSTDECRKVADIMLMRLTGWNR
jgi:hypothetical protein